MSSLRASTSSYSAFLPVNNSTWQRMNTQYMISFLGWKHVLPQPKGFPSASGCITVDICIPPIHSNDQFTCSDLGKQFYHLGVILLHHLAGEMDHCHVVRRQLLPKGVPSVPGRVWREACSAGTWNQTDTGPPSTQSGFQMFTPLGGHVSISQDWGLLRVKGGECCLLVRWLGSLQDIM